MNKLLKKIAGVALGLTMAIGVGVASASSSKTAEPVNAAATTWTISTMSGSYATSGGAVSLTASSKTISWSYGSSTYIGLNSGKVQVGSKNNPQTSNWTFSTDISNFGSNKKITSVSLTAYTTATSATYDISVGGSSKKSGSLTTSSATYTASSLNVSSGTIALTLKGSSSSKAMYLCGLSVTYDDATTPVTALSISGTGISNNALTIGSSDSTAHTINVSITPNNPTDPKVNIAHQSGTPDLFTKSASQITCTNGSGSFTLTGTNATSGSETFRISANTETGKYVDLVVSAQDDSVTYYAVTYNPNNGTVSPTSESIPEDGHPTFPTPTRSGYNFKGWQVNGSGTAYTDPNSYTVTTDVTFVASWVEVYSVTFNSNGGSSSPAAQSVEDGSTFTFPSPGTKSHATFDGWTSTGAAPYYPSGATSPTVTGAITYTAHWTEETPFTVTYNANSGTVSPASESVYNGDHPSFPTPTRSGYAFDGWQVNGSGTAYTNPSDYTVSGDVTFVAKWSKASLLTDTLTRATTGIDDGATVYSSWSGKSASNTNHSQAVYAGQSAGSNNSIQLRSNNSNSGVVSTASGGDLKSVTINFESHTSDTRTVSIYGHTSAYTDPTQLYGTPVGTLLGEINIDNGESQILNVTGSYQYVGIRSKSGALYISSISVVWSAAGAATYSTTEVAISGTIAGTYTTNTSSFNNSGFTVTQKLVNDEDATDIKYETVTSGITYHWEYSNGNTITLPFEAGTQNVRIWAEVEIDSVTYSTKDNASAASQFVTGSITVAETPGEIVITKASSTTTVSGYAEYEWSADGITGCYFITNNGDNMQMQSGNSYIYNTLTVPGYITNITAGLSGTIRELTLWTGETEISQRPATGGTADSTTWSWDIAESSHHHFFYLHNTSSNAAYITELTITYTKVAKVDPTGITISENSITMDHYGSHNLYGTVEPFNANNTTITWTSSNTGFATVDEHGTVEAVAPGTATITASTSNGITTTCTVTVTEALYKKATYAVASSSTLTPEDDYLVGGSATLSTSGTYVSTDEWIQLTKDTSLTITITNYTNQKILGFDLMMASNSKNSEGSLDLSIGGSTKYSIATAGFDDSTWNGAFSTRATNVYKALSPEYVVQTGESIVLTINVSSNSLYLKSFGIRYLDNRLDSWCITFLSGITCDGSGSITSDSQWTTLASSYTALPDDLKEIAELATANKDSSSVIEQAMARYDLIIRKYGTDTSSGGHTDFIGRFGVGKINGPLNQSKYLLSNVIGHNTNTVAIIVIISMVSVTAIGGYFFLRKRKENI